MADPKIRFDVEANATGAAEAAARALRQIGEQQAAITAFERLSAETEAAAQDVALCLPLGSIDAAFAQVQGSGVRQ